MEYRTEDTRKYMDVLLWMVTGLRPKEFQAFIESNLQEIKQGVQILLLEDPVLLPGEGEEELIRTAAFRLWWRRYGDDNGPDEGDPTPPPMPAPGEGRIRELVLA